MAIYIVFDVETPNSANDRMSAIGISAVKDNRIVANYFSLVDPETHFDAFNTQLTGIDAYKVKGAPNFAELWNKIEPIMSKGILVAHNAVFDMSVLRHACGATVSHGNPLRNTCVRSRSAGVFCQICVTTSM